MPINVSYPGVYIQEQPGLNAVISGVATSTTAFVGRTAWGPINEPTVVLSFSDYQRLFGGLHPDCPVSYAVFAFFNNGGSEALIVRLYEAPEDEQATTALLTVDTDKSGQALPANQQLKLEAESPGAWGNHLSASIATDNITDAVAQQFASYGLTKADLFNLTVTWPDPAGQNNRQENFANVTIKNVDAPNRLDKVLENQSLLIRATKGEKDSVVDNFPATPPPAGATGQAKSAVASAPLSPTTYIGDKETKTGIYALEKTQIFNLLCIPPDQTTPVWRDIDPTVWQAAVSYCAEKTAFLIIDPPNSVGKSWYDLLNKGQIDKIDPSVLGISGSDMRYAAVYFPLVEAMDPLRENKTRIFPICGYMAGIYSATDMNRGVWKAPAGMEATIVGASDLQVKLTDGQNGVLNPLGVNCIRDFATAGIIVWGARTLSGQDPLIDDYKYVPVRRLVNYIELSVQQGTQWAVFQPNDETLWSELRLTIGNFLHDLWKQGAFMGATAEQSYKVVCDATTTTPTDQQNGIVNVLIMVAPTRPAEFIIINHQISGLSSP